MKKSLLSAVALTAMVAFGGSAWADVVIAVGAPLTGPNAAFGAQIQKGAEQAAKDINAAGGINGEQIKIVLGDDVSDPKQGISVANKFVADGVKFVIGHFNSGVSIPASEVYAENGILEVTPAATNPVFTERGLWNTFRTCGRDDQQAEVAAKYVLANLKDKKIAVIHDKGAYGKGLADAFKTTLNAGGVTEVLYDALTPGEKDLGALTARLKSENVDIVYFGGYHPEAGLLVRQLKDIGSKAAVIGGDGLSNSEFWNIGSQAGEGTIFTNASDALKNDDSKAAAEALKAANIPAEAFTLNAYAAVEVLKAGIEKAGSAKDAEAVTKALKSGDAFPTAIGKVTYGENGDLTSQTFSLFKWQDGKIVAAE